MGQISTSETPALSGVKVLDRPVLILESIVEAPHTLVEFCEDVGLPRATTHRLAIAPEVHRLATCTPDRRWTADPGLTEITPVTADLLADTVARIFPKLVEATGESMQFYRLTGNTRTYTASMKPVTGLRSTVSVGSRMPLAAGSVTRVLLAFSPVNLAECMLPDVNFNQQDLDNCRRLGRSEFMGERGPALAPVSVLVFDGNQRVIAVLSVSDPTERMTSSSYRCWGVKVLAVVEEMSSRL